MKTFKLSLLHGYLLHGCLYTIPNWHQVVKVKALHAIQLINLSGARGAGPGISLQGLGYSNKKCSSVDSGPRGMILCLSRVYLAAVVEEHPQLDKFAGSCG